MVAVAATTATAAVHSCCCCCCLFSILPIGYSSSPSSMNCVACLTFLANADQQVA